MYTGMLRSRLLDQRLLPLQRQGRIGFYIGATGQEAGVIAGAHAIGPEDYFVPGLRETSAALYRGFPLRTHLAQIFGNTNDLGQGRQMPCHSGSRASRHIVMSSCVSSQLPHATGIAMAAKITGRPDVALGYCGDGGTSEEDFHVALNFAAVFKAPVVFVCQNNQWAISTPLSLQTVSPTIAIKGLAYGMPSLRVDGNDVFAMYVAIKQAVDRARARRRPDLHRGADLPPGRPQLVGRSHPLPRRGRAGRLAAEGSAGALPEVAGGAEHSRRDRRRRPGRPAGTGDPRGHRRRGGGRPAAAVVADRGRVRRADARPCASSWPTWNASAARPASDPWGW